MKLFVFCSLTILLILFSMGQAVAQESNKCRVSVKGGKYRGTNIASIRNDPDVYAGFLLVRPKDVNREFMIALASRLKQEYCHAKKVNVFIFDQKKYANWNSIKDFISSGGKTILMRGAYGFDRESGKDLLEFSTKLGNPTTEIQIDLSEIKDSRNSSNAEAPKNLAADILKPREAVRSSFIFFLNVNEGFAACYKDSLCKTTDGGRSWQIVRDDLANFSFVFVDSKNGWGNSHENSVNQLLMRTHDGGITWRSVADLGSSIQSIAIYDKGIAIASTFQNGIFRSRTDSDNWTPIDINLIGDEDRDLSGDQSELDTGLKEVAFCTEDELIGFGGGIWRSLDHGENWKTELPVWKSTILTDLSIRDRDVYLVGSGDEMLVSKNSMKWLKVKLPTENYEKDKDWLSYNTVFFLSSKIGWVFRDDGSLFQTTDEAKSWDDIYKTEDQFRKIHFISESDGFSVTINGDLLQTKDAGKNWSDIDKN